MYLNWSKFYTPYKERYVKNKVPAVPGVYTMYVLMENQKWDCFFVGNTENLHDTMMHFLNGTENPKIQENIQDYICGFEFAPLENLDERIAATKYLYDRLQPDCMEDPGGKGVKVNVAKSW